MRPDSWYYTEFSKIANIVSGKRPSIRANKCNDETPIPIIGAASIMGFTDKANFTDRILVIGRVGTHGVVQRFSIPCWASDNTLIITSPYYEYANQILQGVDYDLMNRGSTQPLITQGDMKKISVLVPDYETLLKFEDSVRPLMTKLESNIEENNNLAHLRDTLLQKMMSGEINLSDNDV